MLVFIVSALILTTGSAVESLKLPETFPVCKKSAPKYNECILPALEKSVRELKNGNKAFKMLPMDPLEVTKITFNQGNGPVSLNLDLLNSKTYGLTNVKAIAATEEKSPTGKYTLFARGLFPKLQMDADYVIEGKFLILPLTGKGKSNVTITNLECDAHVTGEEWIKEGKTYMKVTQYKADITKIEGMHVHFENLFNGDKVLGESTNTLLNDNWPEFWKELKPSLEATFSQVFEGYTAKIFHNVPYNEIFLD